MGSAEVNKVAFDCAGTPVIRRIVRNMREGGVSRFVIVVGHRSESVMRALDGEAGVLYAYQSEQKGTGHAAGCGLRVLEDIGFSGPVIISMGDKIVSPKIVHDTLERAGEKVKVKGEGEGDVLRADGGWAVLGVQANPGGTSKGHIAWKSGRAFGIVEAKDLKAALAKGDSTPFVIGGERFTAAEIAATPFVNGAFYCFDSVALAAKLRALRADNVQGEIYLTDTIEQFAAEGRLATYEIENPAEMLTYSTKKELRKIIWKFLRKVSDFEIERFGDLENVERLVKRFIALYGDKPAIIASAPGRVNLMGRHIEHRGGSTNMMATDQRMTFIVAPREDDLVRIANLDPAFPSAEFRVPRLSKGSTAAWLDYLERPEVKAELAASRGHWVNYVKSAVYRLQMITEMPLAGMDILAAGNIPIAAGLSSSSALVVATAEAIVALNALNISTRDFVDLCGEGEWFVGSRGGAGDHAAMKCSREGFVTHLKFKPFEIGESVRFPESCAIVVVESGEQAKKAEGARDIFNARIKDYEFAFSEVRRHYPELPLTYFRDLAFLPAGDQVKALGCLTGTARGVAAYGIKECRRAERCVDLLKVRRLRRPGRTDEGLARRRSARQGRIRVLHSPHRRAC